MPPRRHPADELLRPYLEDRDDHVETARRDLHRSVNSRPPPAELDDTRQRLIERVGTDTGNYDLRALERQMRALVEGTAAEKIVEERRRADTAEGKLKTLQEATRKFWSVVLAGLIVAVGSAGIIWAVAALARR